MISGTLKFRPRDKDQEDDDYNNDLIFVHDTNGECRLRVELRLPPDFDSDKHVLYIDVEQADISFRPIRR